MNRLNDQQEALCRQYILDKIAQNATHFTEITRVIDQFQQNSREIEEEIIREQAAVVAVASLALYLRSQQFLGRIVPHDQQIAFYTERQRRYQDGDETVRLPLRTRLYAVYYLQRQVNEARFRGQILTQTQENEILQQRTRQYIQDNIEQDITRQARMFADFKLQGHLMNSRINLTETEKRDYYNIRQARYLQFYQRNDQLIQDFIRNVSNCERTFIQRNTTIDNEFCQNMFGQVIPSVDLINSITILVSDPTYEQLASLREIYNFVVGYCQSINIADVRNLEVRLHPTTFMLYFIVIQHQRQRITTQPRQVPPRQVPPRFEPRRGSTPGFGPGLSRRSRGPAPVGREPPPAQETPPAQAPFGRPFFWEENATPPPPQPPPPPPPQSQPQRQPQRKPEPVFNDDEPCIAKSSVPQPPVCWDNQIKKLYHPNSPRNHGCQQRATYLYQKYDALGLPRNC
jgi:hypothetical protein